MSAIIYGSASLAGLGLVRQTVYNVRDYGAVGNGTTDDTAAVQAAENTATTAGGTVLFPVGVYLTGQLTKQSNTLRRGDGRFSSIIKLKGGTNATHIISQGFSGLTQSDTTGLGIRMFGFENLGFDGNSSNNTSAGNGMQIYGYSYWMKNCRIHHYAGVGFYSEWNDSAGTGGYWNQNTSETGVGEMESMLDNNYIFDCLGGGIDWQGPHDAMMDHTIIARCGPVAAGSSFGATTTIGLKVSGLGYALVCHHLHVWGAQHNKGVWLGNFVGGAGSSAKFDACQIEGAQTAQLQLASNGGVFRGMQLFKGGGNPAGQALGGLILGALTSDGSPANVSVSDNQITDLRIQQQGIAISRSNGHNHITGECYWNDNTQTFYTGTGGSFRNFPDQFDMIIYGDDTTNVVAPGFAARDLNVSSIVPAHRNEQNIQLIPAGYRLANADRHTVTNAAVGSFSTGRLSLWGMRIPAGTTISTITLIAGTTPGSGLSHMWAALFDASGNKLVVSADDTATAWAASTAKTFTLTTPYTAQVDTDVYVGACVVGTPPTLAGMTGGALTTSGMAALSPLPGANGTSSLTDPSSAPNPTSISASSNMAYVLLN